MGNPILITWLIGVILSSILVYIWSILYIGDTEWGMHKIPVNIIIAGLYVIFSFIPVLNIFHLFIWIQILSLRTQRYKYIQLRLPKWLTKTIK